jgi:signal transduction histidine kinase
MHRFRRPFEKLHWRLTLSYILVTLVVALIIEAVNTVAIIAIDQAGQQSNQKNYFAKSLADLVAPQLPPYLEQSPPDKQGLTAWIETLMYPYNHPQANPSVEKAGCCFSSNFALLAVLDIDGQVLVSASSTGAINPNDIKNPQAQQVIHVALLGDQYPPDQTRTLPDGRTVVAVPILAQDRKRVLGALFTIPVGQALTYTAKPTGALARILNALNPSALYFMLLACVVGTLSGLLASRGITHRLRKIARATHSWSQGEFQVEVEDRSSDELGQLAGDLNSMAEQLQHLITARQELAVLEERHRLARDLHDSIKQQLFVITMLVGAARAQVSAHPHAAQTLSEAERLAGQTQQELNALIRALHPVALTGKGLGAALQDLLSDWSQSTGIAAELNLASNVSLPLETEQEIFRVVQEALTNVARHSGATAIEASVVGEPERVRLTVEDNGHGFSIAQNSGQGQGLRSMSERVEALGGTLLIFSTSAGTRVEAHIPLPPRSSVERDQKTTTSSSLGM